MTDRAGEWSEHDLHRRFDLGPPRDELTGLAATLDGLLGRIEAALRHEHRFSAEVAHELRTPLAGVRGEAELALLQGRSPADLRAALQQVVAGTDRMTAVIDALLAGARQEAARAPGSSDARDAVETVLEVVRPAAEAHHVALQVAHAPGPMSVGADENIVAQALHPLLENAVRHADATVGVRLRRSAGEVVIAVEDDGPGVAPEALDGIFEPGVSHADGAGLGLPLARRLARTCDGEVLALPGGDGGRFELHLPAIAAGA
jgi:signal transduction histidine kinase